MNINYSYSKISFLYSTKPSMRNRLLLMVLFVCLFSNVVSAATITSKAVTGNWDATSSWVGGAVPASSDNVIIVSGAVISLTGNLTHTGVITINAGGTISDGGFSLKIDNKLNPGMTVNGTFKVTAANGLNKGNGAGGNTTVVVNSGGLIWLSTTFATVGVSNWINNPGSMVKLDAAGAQTLDNSFVGAGIDFLILAGSGIKSLGEATTVSQNLSMQGSATLNLNGKSLTYGSGSVLEYNGWTGTTGSEWPATFSTATGGIQVINNSTVTLNQNKTLNAIPLTIKTGTLSNGGFAITGSAGKIFTIANGATFQVAGSTSSFPTGFGTNSLAPSSTVEYNGNGNQTVSNVASPGYGNLILSTSGTKTVAGALAIQGNVNINNTAILDALNFTHNVAGNWTNNGAFTAGSSTVNFNSTTSGKIISGTISGGAGQFYNLTFNGVGGGWTVSTKLDVANKLTVSNGKVNVSGIVTVLGNVPVTVSAGTLNFDDGSSLMQTGFTGANVGNITYNRITSTPIDNFDYTYWSSPVSPQKLIDVSPNTSLDKFYSFNLGTYDWQQEDPATKNMVSGIGYIIRGPQTFVAPAPPNFYKASFIGVPNNGVVTVAIPPTAAALDASALIGNPYPSALDADLFLKTNMTTALEGTLYLWTHNTNIGVGTQNLGSGAYAYTSDDYATYNLTGGSATGTGTAAAGLNNSVPNGKIASGQAFFAGVNPAGGTVTFNNSMRIGSGILDNSQFFKLNNTKSKESGSVEKDRVWLNLYNSQGAFKQALVGYITGATNEYDNGYDGATFDGNEFVDFYSVNQDKNLVIQGRALPFDEADEVPLGYKTTIVGDFTIDIAQTDGLLATKEIFLEDKEAQTVINLKEGYTFTTQAGTFNDRFVLRYTNKTLGTVDFDKGNDQVLVSAKNKQIKINSSTEPIDKVQVYDLLGRQLFKKSLVNNNEFVIVNLGASEQTLLVKIILQNGQTVSKKIIY